MSKYNSKKIVIDGYTFDSKDEGKYYEMLKDLKAKGKILNFEFQPVFILQDSFKKNNRTYRQITYIADFRVYVDENINYIVDVKGMFTEAFKLKLKLFQYKYPDIELKLECRNLKYGNEYGFIDYYELQKIRRKNKRVKK